MLETILETVEKYVWSHWPFFAFVLIAIMFGQWFKHNVFTKENAFFHGKTGPAYSFMGHIVFHWGRRTLPLHPVLTGVALGFFLRSPEDKINFPHSMLYFAAAGVASVFGYEVFMRIAKKRGLDFTVNPWDVDAK